MKKCVLFTASTFSHIVNFHLPYLRWFREQGWTVHVSCGGGKVSIPYASETFEIPFEKKMSSPANFRAARLLRRKIKQERYALIVTHTSLAAFFTRLAVAGMPERPKLVNMVHGYLFDDETSATKRMVLLAAERMTARQTDLLLTMNRYDNELAKKYRLGKKIAQIPGVGVDFEARTAATAEDGARLRVKYQIPEDAFVLVYPAEFSARKSQSILIRAMEDLPKNVYLVLPGDGARLSECQEQAQKMEGRVIFPGYASNMAVWYAAANAAVTSSRSEGLPFNVMEAMYAGLPVVASAVKGHVDLIRHGETGLLYPYGDAGACAGQIQALLSSEDLRRKLGRRAREEASPYSLERVFPQVTAFYHAFCFTDAERK